MMPDPDSHAERQPVVARPPWTDSAQHTRAIVEAALDCIIVMDHEGRVMEFNPAAEQTFGYSREEALGQEMARLIIPPALQEHHRAGLARYLATGEARILRQRIELPAIRKSGEEIAVELTVVPIENSEHPVFAGFVRDVTRSKQRERALQESEERFRSLVETTTHIIWVRAPGGEFVSEQPSWSAFTGQPFDELRGWGWLQAIHPEDRERVAQRWVEAVLRPGPYENEYRLRRWDGEYRHMSIRGVPIFEKDGGASLREWVGVNTDVTEEKRAQEFMAKTQEFQRAFLRDVLFSVSEGKLRLCDSEEELPPPLTPVCEFFPLRRETLGPLRRTVRVGAETTGFSPDRWQDLLTAVGEAAMNAVVHAGGGEARVCASEETLQVWIEDQGKGIAMDTLPRATLERGYTTAGTLGHGFWMMLRTVDRIWLLTQPTGTTVVIEQDKTQADPLWVREVTLHTG